MKTKLLLFIAVAFTTAWCRVTAKTSSVSFYTQRPADKEAVYFTPDSFPIKADGKTDVSDALQMAINKVKINYNFGIVFIPEGKYLISKTIYIPASVRVIGYGKTRPLIMLANNAPGFQTENPDDKGQASYMFWFTGGLVKPGEPIRDANAGTFYSALSNIDLQIGDGNPAAVALRTHYAQHSFVSHVNIYIGNGKAGMFDVGNEMEDVRFYGGDYGIYTTKTSPGWQFVMLDTYFEGQRKVAIKTQQAGLTIIRMQVKNVPTAISVDEDFWEKLYVEDAQLQNISGPAFIISNRDNANTQVSLLNINCSNVQQFLKFRESEKPVEGTGKIYRVKRFIHGLQMDELWATPETKTISEIEPLKAFPAPVATDIPALPAMESWVNLQSLGAVGDGEFDNTRILKDAIEKYATIYLPQGWYRVTQTIKLKPNTALIGLNPISTQILLKDNETAFGSFGGPKALIESAEGGQNILTGIGLSTGNINSRAVACKWMSGQQSYLNDIKFIGGHGTMNRPKTPGEKPSWVPQNEKAWDSQYWSLWITNHGGGIFKNIWSASTYATSGVYTSYTSTPGKIYALSVEHHVRNEVRFKQVENWKVYALQLEEEGKESWNCQPLEIEKCDNMLFANLYMFRVIRIINPYPYSARTWDCSNVEFLNVHNYTQIKYTTSLPLYDINTNTEIRPWEFNRLLISDAQLAVDDYKQPFQPEKLVKGFEFADGACHDSKGNVYFSESRWRRVYKWSVETQSLSLICDFPWEPLSLACDKNDQLLVVFKYYPQPGYLKDGKPEVFENPADAAGTSFSMWGNSGFGVFVYAIDPNRPEETIEQLKTVPVNSITNVYKALYPSNRWRDGGDFNTVTLNQPENCFVAPDGVTIFPICYDYARANCLVEAYPGKTLYATDEYNKRIVKYDVTGKGYLANLKYFVEKGEFSSATDADGNVYVADGDIYVFNEAGEQINLIKTPERPITLNFGGKDMNTLFFTTANALYSFNIK